MHAAGKLHTRTMYRYNAQARENSEVGSIICKCQSSIPVLYRRHKRADVCAHMEESALQISEFSRARLRLDPRCQSTLVACARELEALRGLLLACLCASIGRRLGAQDDVRCSWQAEKGSACSVRGNEAQALICESYERAGPCGDGRPSGITATNS